MFSLYNGDCLDVMKDLKDNSVDLVVTSPPYDNLRSYKGNVKLWNFDKFKEIAKQLYRIVKEGGVVVWVVGDAVINGSETGTSFKQALFFKKCGFRLHDTMIWEKESFTFPDLLRYRNCFEYMFILSKGKPKTINKICDRKNKWAGCKVHGTSRDIDGSVFRKLNHNKTLVKEFGERFNVWKINTEKHNKTGHPAVFPLQLAKDHIVSWSNEGDIVFDPFMGSATTGLACKELNRNFIGSELEKEYFDISCERIMFD